MGNHNWLVLNLILFVCQFAVFLSVYRPVSEDRNYRRQCAVFIVLDSVVYTIAVHRTGFQSAFHLAFFIRTLPSVCFFYRKAKYKGSRFWVTYCIADVAVSLADMLGIIVAADIGGNTMAAHFAVCLVCMVAAVAVMLLFVRRFFVSVLQSVGEGWGFATAVMILFYFLSAAYFSCMEHQGKSSAGFLEAVIFIVTMYFSIALVLYAIYHMGKENEKRIAEQEQKNIIWLAKMRVEQGERQYRDMMENMEKLSIIRHDLSHHFRMISDYCNTGQYEKINKYLQQINFQETAGQLKIYCNNHVANVILGYYAKEAKEAGITFLCEADIPDGIPENEMDLSIILGNSLENALEACRNTDKDRCIEVKMRYESLRLVISIKNTFNGVLREKDGRLTTEKHQEGHGLGLKSIENAVKKYRGYLNYTKTGNQFCLQIVLNLSDT